MSVGGKLDKLRQQLQEQELDSILVSSSENRRYLSGFSGSAGYLLISQTEAVLATDFRYIEQAGRQAPDFKVERIGGRGTWLPKLASEMELQRVGFESEDLTVATHSALQKAIEDSDGASRPMLVTTSGIVERLRAYKYEYELELLAKAVEIADQAMDEISPTIEPGVTEAEVAWKLEVAMRERGAEAIAFDTIVAAGPNGALPHHRAGDKVIQQGEAVVVDMGATYQGYCSDLSRTFIVGEPDETFRRVYDTVLHAQTTAEEKVAAGMTGTETDAIARDIIADAGYGENFGHSLGHGVGLAVHESPGVGPNSGEPLEDGMVFTIEPGVYLSGWGGVRIEDMVVMENGRARIISNARKLA